MASQSHTDGFLHVKRFCAGAFAGAFTKTSVAPVERLKSLLQLVEGQRGFLPTLRVVLQQEGVVSFWRGNGANVARVMPVYGTRMALNDYFKALFASGPGPLTTLQLLMAASCAALVQHTLTMPLEGVRTRLTVGSMLQPPLHYRGIWHCLCDTVQREGVLALYKGLAATWISGVPYIAIQYTLYQRIKDHVPHEENGKPSALWNLFAGGSAGLIAQTAMYPGDTVRKLMILNGAHGKPRRYTNTWDCIRQVYAQEGLARFWRGVGANALRAIPESAIQFWIYDVVKRSVGVADL